MSDETTGVYQSGNTDAGQEQQPEGEQPKYVTEEVLNKSLEKFWNSVQQVTNKQENRIAKRIEEWEKSVKAQGYEVDDDTRKAAHRKIALDMLDQVGDVAAQPNASPNAELAVKVARVNKQLAEIDAEFGGALSDDDDEKSQVNFNVNPKDPEGVKFLRAYRAAQQAKAQRLATEGGQPQPNATDPQARMRAPGGAPTGNRAEQITAELNQLMKRPSENPKRIHELSTELGNLLRSK